MMRRMMLVIVMVALQAGLLASVSQLWRGDRLPNHYHSLWVAL